MDIIAYKCLEGFHRRFAEEDDNPKLQNFDAFIKMMQHDYSGENLAARIIDTDEYWDKMLNAYGFGKGVKYDKAQKYREELTTTWNDIKTTIDNRDEVEISKLMGRLLWDMDDNEFNHTYLGVVEEAIKHNKFWKSPVVSDIFCSYFGFVQGFNKELKEIAAENSITLNRAYQLKDKLLNNYELDFWFLKSDLIKDKLESLFDLSAHSIEEISEQTEQINQREGVHFTKEFYTKVLAVTFGFKLIGNINDIKVKNKKSSDRNVWSNLYLQNKEEYKRCHLDKLIDALAKELHKNGCRFEEDTNFDISPYITIGLSHHEIESYNLILAKEFEQTIELDKNQAVFKRNSLITQPEMAEAALRDLGGFAYADDILIKVKELYPVISESTPKKKWTREILRTSLLRVPSIYTVGKSGLYGLVDVKDLRSLMGSGDLNDVIRLYLEGRESPTHIFELFNHINSIFPRPRTLHTVHTILQQNSRVYFRKFIGEYYGLNDKEYHNVDFPKVVGGHGRYLSKIIKTSDGLSFEDVFIKFNDQYGLTEIQVEYLLYLGVENERFSLIDGLYKPYISLEESEIEDQLAPQKQEVDVEVDEEDVAFDELNHPDIPGELLNDAIAQIKVRRGQPRFRYKLLKFYHGTCIITDCKIPELLEAAHVLPYSVKKDNSLSNGLLLRADIHTLFDLGMIAIDPERMQLKLNSTLIESREYDELIDLDIGVRLAELHQDYTINQVGLDYRWKSFIEEE